MITTGWGEIIAVELKCPKGHLTIEKNPYFELTLEYAGGSWEDCPEQDGYPAGSIDATCEGCGTRFTSRING